MKSNGIIDLSQHIDSLTPLFPGTLSPEISIVANHEDEGYLEHRISYHSHTGTHIDAPSHILPRGKNLSDFNLDYFIGKGVCIQVPNTDVIDSKFIILHKHMLSVANFALFCTGKGKEWGNESYFQNYPIFSKNAAQMLATFNLKAIGMDTCSPDPLDSTELIVHKTLLKYNILIIENLRCMAELVGKNFIFHAIPLKTGLKDGAPVRAFAIIS